MRILTHLNLSQNELQNAVLHKLGQAPANPVVGQIYFNTTDKQAYIYQETGWENLGLSNSLLEKLINIETGADKVLYGTLPAASADNAGQVIIYTGTETEDYKPGLVYISNGTTWEEAVPTMEGAATESVEVSVDEGVISANVRVSADANNALTIKTVEGVEGLFVEATEVGSASADEDGLMTSDDKKKLDSIEEGAQVNIIEGVKFNGVTATIGGDKVATITLAEAGAEAGLMSAADKAKLDAVAAGANVNVIEKVSLNGAEVAIENKEAKIAIAEATTTAAGLMSAADKVALGNKQDKLSTVEGNYLTIDENNTIKVDIPMAAADKLGVIKIGEGLAIDADGKVNVTGAAEAASVKWENVTNKPSSLGTPITAGTHTKITYDENGLVVKGEDLTADDIPDLSAKYINVDQKGVANGVAELDENAKISLEQLPDAVLGNVRFGGTFDPATGVVTLVDGKIVDANGNELTQLTITKDNAADFRGYYFIASADGEVEEVAEFLVGDWCISNGTAGWAKVDNTDAVVGVKGAKETEYRIGQINITAANVGAVEANEIPMTAGTYAKVTVDAKGLVTAGEEKIKLEDIEDIADLTNSYVELNQGAEAANKALVTDQSGNVVTVAHKYVATIGDGEATTFTIEHGMATKDIIVQVSDAATFDVVYANIKIADENSIVLNFANAPVSGAYRVIVIA